MKILHNTATSLPYKKFGYLKYYAANITLEQGIVTEMSSDNEDTFGVIHVVLHLMRPGFEGNTDFLSFTIDTESKEEFKEAIETLQVIKNDIATIINVLQLQQDSIVDTNSNDDSNECSLV